MSIHTLSASVPAAVLYPILYNPAEGNLVFQTQSRPYLRRLADGTEAMTDGAADADLVGVPIASGISPVQEQQGESLVKLHESLKALSQTIEHLSARVASLEEAHRRGHTPAKAPETKHSSKGG